MCVTSLLQVVIKGSLEEHGTLAFDDVTLTKETCSIAFVIG